MVTEEMIGPRIRELRRERSMTQDLLAHLAGLTTGYICRIENSPTSPPVSTLMKISEALGVGVEAIFSEEEAPAGYTLVRAADRKPFSYNGLSFEFLAPRYPNRHMDPFILTMPAAAGKTHGDRRAGEQLSFGLEGRCNFRIGEETVELGEDDCIYYNRSVHYEAEGVDGSEVISLVVQWKPEKPEKDADRD